MTHCDTYDLVITRFEGKEVFLHESSDCAGLPRAVVPRHARLARDLTAAVTDKWGLKTVCLFGISTPASSTLKNLQVLECLESTADLPSNGRWLPLAVASSVLHGEDLRILDAAIEQLDGYASGTVDNVFARSGWMPDLLGWVSDNLKPHGLHLNGRWTQFGAGPHYNLLRLETDGPAVWFKAAGDTPREFNVMTRLAPNEPRFFPRLIASRADWSAWLSFEASGLTLDLVTDPQQWIKAAESLGGLQTAFCEADELLLRLGCMDWRAGHVLPNIEPLFEAIKGFMRNQPPRTGTSPLSDSQLTELAQRVRVACERFYSLRAPCSLNNMDFNPTNAISAPDKIVFIDWSAACLAHPFVTFEFLIADLLLEQPKLRSAVGPSRDAYSLALQKGFHFEQIDEQFRLSPIVAALLFTINCWQAAERLGTDSWEPLLRSMARRLRKEVEAAGAAVEQ
jgi:hypothetical protein